MFHTSGSSFDRQGCCPVLGEQLASDSQLLAIAHIQNTAQGQTANRSGPLLPWAMLCPSGLLIAFQLRYRHTAQFATPIRVDASMGLSDVMSRKPL